GEPKVTKRLWALSESLLPGERLVDYTQAIMDLGATLCTARNPACGRCPVSADCTAHLQGTVARFPAPRPKRERPLRHARLLLVENAKGELLFERRPPAGIWGGLWCLPVLEGEEDVAEWLLREHGLSARATETLAPISQGFTHFELELSPVRLRAAAGSTSLREQAPLRWINIAADALPGLPAPVAKLLARLNAPPEPQQALALEPIPQTRRRTPRKTAAPLK
ncbi:MAG TPA: NUDIX domain-containing protein, partial [Nevskia sp.]|nr:NUDIX domain-containing protein [Nevskia sp.]